LPAVGDGLPQLGWPDAGDIAARSAAPSRQVVAWMIARGLMMMDLL
jgi:hypothetical protein